MCVCGTPPAICGVSLQNHIFVNFNGFIFILGDLLILFVWLMTFCTTEFLQFSLSECIHWAFEFHPQLLIHIDILALLTPFSLELYTHSNFTIVKSDCILVCTSSLFYLWCVYVVWVWGSTFVDYKPSVYRCLLRAKLIRFITAWAATNGTY